jgi:Dolichyl-phosphate-mannose-protein mannosyltransferase
VRLWPLPAARAPAGGDDAGDETAKPMAISSMNGLDAVGPRERRIGAGLVSLGIVLFWLGATYGLAGPFYYGHYGYHGGSYATWARGTLRQHTIYPVNEPGFAPPTPQSYYIHHPVLTHQLVTLTFALFGEHEWSVRLAAIIPSFASLLLVAAIAWRYLGPLSGGAAAVVFALVPVNVWYESHIDQGFPSIAFLLAFFWFYLAWLRSGRFRFGIAALLSELMAGNFEWSPYFAFPVIFAHVLTVGVRRRGRYLAFAALHPLTVILPLALHFFLVARVNLLGDLRAAYGNRTSEIAYAVFARGMRDYAETLFGAPLMVAMVAWLVLVVVRRARGGGSNLDLIGLTFAFSLITYWHVFKTAVVTHAYRQLYGNVWATWAVADLVAEGRLWGQRWFSRRPPQRTWSGTLAAAGVLAAAAVLTAPVSWAGLLESRLHGGVPLWKTFNPDLRQTAFAIEVERTTSPADVLYFHSSFAYPPPRRMDWAFYYDRDLRRWAELRELQALPARERAHAVVILLPEQLGRDELRAFGALATQHPVWQIEDLAALDLRVFGRRTEAFRLAPVDRSRTSAWRRWLEGPYPFPRLVRDGALSTRLDARIAEGAALARVVAPAVPALRARARP